MLPPKVPEDADHRHPALQRLRLLDAGLAEFAGAGLKHLTVQVERDNHNGRRFYERAGFVDPRELTSDVQGYVLALVEYRRPILGSASLTSQSIT